MSVFFCFFGVFYVGMDAVEMLGEFFVVCPDEEDVIYISEPAGWLVEYSLWYFILLDILLLKYV